MSPDLAAFDFPAAFPSYFLPTVTLNREISLNRTPAAVSLPLREATYPQPGAEDIGLGKLGRRDPAVRRQTSDVRQACLPEGSLRPRPDSHEGPRASQCAHSSIAIDAITSSL